MEGRVGQLRCHYRLLAAQGATGAASACLDRVARERLSDAYASALEQVLGDDPTVYVLRSLHAQVMLNMEDNPSDARLAQRWGGHLAGVVMQAMARDDGAEIVRFADQAAYVAQFVQDLMHGIAWSRWFYGAFASHRFRPVADAIAAVLLEQRDHLPAILTRLQGDGAIERLVTMLDEVSLQRLWLQCLGATDPSGAEMLAAATATGEPEPSRTPIEVDPAARWRAEAEMERPLFASALRLLDTLELWAGPRLDGEALFAAYEGSLAMPPDWRDRRALAMALFAAVRYLASRQQLQPVASTEHSAFVSRLDAALAALDWLDVDWLRVALVDLLAAPERAATGLPVRPLDHGPTPRQRELLDDLGTVLRHGVARLDHSRPDAPANALRLYTALTAHAPRWSGDSMAGQLIQRLLRAYALLTRAVLPGEAMYWLRRGDVARALRTVSTDARGEATDIFAMIVAWGEPALALVDALARDHLPFGTAPRTPDVPGQQAPGRDAMAAPAVARAGMASECAGVFLLLRPLLDIQLPWLAAQTQYPRGAWPAPLGALVTALALSWAGAAGLTGDRIDAGLSILAGVDGPITLDDLRQAWSASETKHHGSFQMAVLHALSAHRLAPGPELQLYRVTASEGRFALVGGDGSAGLWPVGRTIEAADDVAAIVAAWLDAWEEVTGGRPTAVSVDESLLDRAALPGRHGVPRVVTVPEAAATTSHPGSGEIEAAHRAGRSALQAALPALGYGRLGPAEADLTVTLTAGALLRLWARWLRQFAESSIPFLLDNFVRRPGWLTVEADRIMVVLEPRPLDIVIDMAGYGGTLERVPWLNGHDVHYHIARS